MFAPFVNTNGTKNSPPTVFNLSEKKQTVFVQLSPFEGCHAALSQALRLCESLHVRSGRITTRYAVTGSARPPPKFGDAIPEVKASKQGW